MNLEELQELHKSIQAYTTCLKGIDRDINSLNNIIKELREIKARKQKALTLMEVQREEAFSNVQIIPKGFGKKSKPKVFKEKASKAEVKKEVNMDTAKALFDSMSDEAKAKFLEGLLQD